MPTPSYATRALRGTAGRGGAGGGQLAQDPHVNVSSALPFDFSKGILFPTFPKSPISFQLIGCGIILGLMWCVRDNLLSVQQGKCASLAHFIC